MGRVLNSSITNSFSTGNVSGMSSVGGVVGNLHLSSITNSFATGDVNGRTWVGGVAGSINSGNITNSYSISNVNGIGQVGGLVGHIANGSSITNSFATGNVSGDESIGGLVGSVQSTGDSILNSVAINTTVTRNTGSNMHFGRVVSTSGFTFILSNNHANNGMALPTGVVAISNPNGIHGESAELADTETQNWWSDTARFIFGITKTSPWQWCTNNLRPRLYWE